MTPAQFRKSALALPGAEEGSHGGHPDFRAGGKVFAGLTADEKKASLKLTPEIQATILGDSSGAFEPASGAWGERGWTVVVLANAPVAIVKPLLAEAHSSVAKKAPTAPKARRSPRRRS